jgi:hypothetical protein
MNSLVRPGGSLPKLRISAVMAFWFWSSARRTRDGLMCWPRSQSRRMFVSGETSLSRPWKSDPINLVQRRSSRLRFRSASRVARSLGGGLDPSADLSASSMMNFSGPRCSRAGSCSRSAPARCRGLVGRRLRRRCPRRGRRGRGGLECSRGACGSPPWVGSEWNFTNSISPWPSGVRSIASSALVPLSAMIRSTQLPSTWPLPPGSSPSSTKNSIAAARSLTTIPTCSIFLIAMCSMVGTPAIWRSHRDRIDAAVPLPARRTRPFQASSRSQLPSQR